MTPPLAMEAVRTPEEVQVSVPVPFPAAVQVMPAPPVLVAGQVATDVEFCKPEPSVIVMTTAPFVFTPDVMVVIV
jgi:hypothetical protein